MDVVGFDGLKIGIVDGVEGDRIKLKKSESWRPPQATSSLYRHGFSWTASRIKKCGSAPMPTSSNSLRKKSPDAPSIEIGTNSPAAARSVRRMAHHITIAMDSRGEVRS